MIRTGAVYEPPEKVGLAALTGTVMRTGGTARMTGDQIDEELEFLAANVAIGIGSESGTASLDILKKDLEQGLAIFADMLRAPACDPAKVGLARRQALQAIRRRPDSPAGVAGREFRKLRYGADHPLGRESSIETVSRITREDLVAFHRQYFTPTGLILGVTGDFEKPAMLDALRKTFGDWKSQPVTLPAIPPVTASPAAGGSPSVNNLRRGLPPNPLPLRHLSGKEDDPDFFRLAPLGGILAGDTF